MTAKEMMLEYAVKHNDSQFDKLTNAEFCGKMIKENVVVRRTPTTMTFAHIARKGNTISLTETTETTTTEVTDGKVVFSKSSATITVWEAQA